MTMRRVNVAVIGAGRMAAEHIRAFADIPEVTIAGIYSRTRAKAEALASRFHIGGVHDTIDALYHRSCAHLVVIAVSELSLHDVCTEAFLHPWICLLEKPAGYNLQDAQDIAKLAGTSQCAAYVALNRRHYSSTRSVLTEAAAIEMPRLIQVFDQEDPAPRYADRPRAVVDNWMYANSIHVVDYLRIFGRGEVTTVTPIIRWNPFEPRFVAARVDFSSGDLGLYSAVWNGPGPWAATITTQAKRWELKPLEQASVQPHGDRKMAPLPVHPWDVAFKPGLRLQAEQAVKAVWGEPHSLPSLEEGLQSVRLVHAIYET